jgi:hypothetical protein
VVDGLSLILYGETPENPSPSVATALLPIIDQQGVEAGLEQYRTLKKEHAEEAGCRVPGYGIAY